MSCWNWVNVDMPTSKTESAGKLDPPLSKPNRRAASFLGHLGQRNGAPCRVVQFRQETLAEIGLYQLCIDSQLSQIDPAERREITQSVLSHIEHAEDLRICTLRNDIERIGGQPKIEASFPDGQRIPLVIDRKRRKSRRILGPRQLAGELRAGGGHTRCSEREAGLKSCEVFVKSLVFIVRERRLSRRRNETWTLTHVESEPDHTEEQ